MSNRHIRKRSRFATATPNPFTNDHDDYAPLDRPDSFYDVDRPAPRATARRVGTSSDLPVSTDSDPQVLPTSPSDGDLAPAPAFAPGSSASTGVTRTVRYFRRRPGAAPPQGDPVPRSTLPPQSNGNSAPASSHVRLFRPRPSSTLGYSLPPQARPVRYFSRPSRPAPVSYFPYSPPSRVAPQTYVWPPSSIPPWRPFLTVPIRDSAYYEILPGFRVPSLKTTVGSMGTHVPLLRPNKFRTKTAYHDPPSLAHYLLGVIFDYHQLDKTVDFRWLSKLLRSWSDSGKSDSIIAQKLRKLISTYQLMLHKRTSPRRAPPPFPQIPEVRAHVPVW